MLRLLFTTKELRWFSHKGPAMWLRCTSALTQPHKYEWGSRILSSRQCWPSSLNLVVVNPADVSAYWVDGPWNNSFVSLFLLTPFMSQCLTLSPLWTLTKLTRSHWEELDMSCHYLELREKIQFSTWPGRVKWKIGCSKPHAGEREEISSFGELTFSYPHTKLT